MKAFSTIVLAIVLAIVLSQGAPAFAQTSKKAPPAVQAEFTEFIARFRAALKANDAVAVAGMAKLPFEGDAAVSNAAQFQKEIYRSYFSTKDRACIQRGAAVYDRDQENNDNYHIFCGEMIYTFTKTPAGFLLRYIGEND
ncbi:hypothetical protein [Bradyrhizobium sp. Ec3.3]|uniref:hypothetical protein n=1 Tax=Bradyrhizobium sp. Ec3.3 TaxID=189753 RepID=UPI000400A3E8|nr:hypothetical protein [Bradyrhizobium sp. Ec3.3]